MYSPAASGQLWQWDRSNPGLCPGSAPVYQAKGLSQAASPCRTHSGVIGIPKSNPKSQADWCHPPQNTL